MSQNKKEICIYTLCVLIATNILWYAGLSIERIDENNLFGSILSTVACFVPLIIAFIMCKISKQKFRILKLKPNIKKSWKVYLISILISLVLVYMSDLLPLVFFPKDVSINVESLKIGFFLQIALYVVIGVIASIELLGEEVGWMGYLYPRLEKEYGIFKSAFLLSIVRSLFHLVLLLFVYENISDAMIGLLFLFVSNFALISILIYVTKRSDSVFPASIIHALTNTLAVLSFISVKEEFTITIPYRLVGLIPIVIVGSIFYILLYKKDKKV